MGISSSKKLSTSPLTAITAPTCYGASSNKDSFVKVNIFKIKLIVKNGVFVIKARFKKIGVCA